MTTPANSRTKSRTSRKKRRARRRSLEAPAQIADRHFRFGWWMIFIFVVMGIVLEAMHGFKVGWYLDTDHATRRTLLMVAHGFGVILGIIHVGFAAMAIAAPHWHPHHRAFASSCLVAAGLMIPSGLILSAVYQRRDGQAGIGIVLALAGLALTILALTYTAAGARSTIAATPHVGDGSRPS